MVTRRSFLLGTLFAPLLKFLPKRRREIHGKMSWAEWERVLEKVQEKHYAEMGDYPGFALKYTVSRDVLMDMSRR